VSPTGIAAAASLSIAYPPTGANNRSFHLLDDLGEAVDSFGATGEPNRIRQGLVML
jgi:hypothetical protein